MDVMIRSSYTWHDFLHWSCCVQPSTTVAPQNAYIAAGGLHFPQGLYVLQLLHAPKFQTYHGVLITFAFWQFSLFRLHRLKMGPHIVTWCQAEPADTHIQLAACFTTGLRNCQVSSTTGWDTIASQVVEHNSNFTKVYGGWSQGVAGIIDQLITGEHPPVTKFGIKSIWSAINKRNFTTLLLSTA